MLLSIPTDGIRHHTMFLDGADTGRSASSMLDVRRRAEYGAPRCLPGCGAARLSASRIGRGIVQQPNRPAARLRRPVRAVVRRAAGLPHGMTKKSGRIPDKGIDHVTPMRDNEEAASTSGRPAPQTETGIIFRTQASGVLTRRVRNQGGGGGGWARGAGRGGGGFSRSCRGTGVGQGLDQGVRRQSNPAGAGRLTSLL